MTEPVDKPIPDTRLPRLVAAYPVDEGVGVVDLLFQLGKHRWTLIKYMVALAIVAAIYILGVHEQRFMVRSVIELGQVSFEGRLRAVVDPDYLTSKIKLQWMPQVRKRDDFTGIGQLSNLEVHSPRNSNLLVIENKVTEGHIDAAREFHRAFVTLIMGELTRYSDLAWAHTGVQIALQKQNIDELEKMSAPDLDEQIGYLREGARILEESRELAGSRAMQVAEVSDNPVGLTVNLLVACLGLLVVLASLLFTLITIKVSAEIRGYTAREGKED